MAKNKFELQGTGRVRCFIDGKHIIALPGDVIAIDTEDENYDYFVQETRWVKVGHKEVKNDDIKDDGVRNFSNEPMKNEKGRYKK